MLLISSYPPRQCGIATFTQDLARAINKRYGPHAEICAIDENGSRKYGKIVKMQISEGNLESYSSAVKEINSDDTIKIVNIQHEFGLFGGETGECFLAFLKAITKPIVTTFHTVIPNPNDNLKETVRTISDISQAVVVMNKQSVNILKREYKVNPKKIFYIPHGIPQAPFESSEKYKEELGYKDRFILSTFGLINKNKGIEYVIKAIPEIIKDHPEVIYLVIGKTHPEVKKKEGESYRKFLKKEVKKLNLQKNVVFLNKYFPLEKLISLLQATDVYIFSSIDKNQSVSGTLSYALGLGKAVISTRTEYSRHILNKDNGILVDAENPDQIARSVLKLMSDRKAFKALSVQAYKNSRDMIWPNVAQDYFKLYLKISKIKNGKNRFPELNFDHIFRLTDKFGIIQHATYSKPNKEFGYSSDDVARALIACLMHFRKNPEEKIKELINIYFNFLLYARRKDGSFCNIISISKQRDDTSEGDVFGRIIWALGYASSFPNPVQSKSLKLFKHSIENISSYKSPRSLSFAITGIYYYLKQYKDEKIKDIFSKLSDRLLETFLITSKLDWTWFEEALTYSNSKMPEALFMAYDILKDEKYLLAAESSLKFLDSVTFLKNYYNPIGQKKWYFKGGERCWFDQQPEDACSAVQAKITAYKITKNTKHLKDALKAFNWFLGKNALKQMVYDEVTGGCCDGLEKKGLNLNQGAESTLSYLLARLLFEEKDVKKAVSKLS